MPHLINPWVETVEQFPGALFPWLDPQTEMRTIRNQIEEHAGLVNLEFGSGSGNHIIEQAAQHPNVLWVGFELRYKRSARTMQKASQAGLENVIIVRTDAFLAGEIIPAGRVSKAFIRFPDPWAKLRWKKHRLLNPKMLTMLHKLLVTGGTLSVTTDHREMYLEFLDDVTADPEFEILSSIVDRPVEKPQSEFESLFASKGQSVSHLLAKTIY